ncbi:Uncharacterised protein [Streptococcus pneumoniae]|nr:Uncharacterised protein [Streptococcus pneumoniae]CJC50065.1 Uncharacterised protein [Streptococcus pneumoniae]
MSSFVILEEEINPIEPLPYSSLIAPNLFATTFNASSHVDSTNVPFLRIKGFVIRSLEFTKSQPNFPLTQVEIALTGASEEGCTLRILRPFVHTSNEHPTPQNVHTVFVFFVRVSRMAASTSDTAKIPLYPGSTSLIKSTIGSRISGFNPVINPASPSIVFSIKALQGQIVTH